MYATAQRVVGWTVTVTAGDASVYAGTPNGSHGPLASLSAGQSFTVPTLSAGVVISLQGGGGFGYTLTPGTGPVSPAPTPACTDPTTCDPVSWVSSVWRYNGPGSNHPDDWIGGVIAWPSWSAYSSNNRDDLNSRTVYSESGEKLYPYMGGWADGCEIEVVTGGVLVIEWERGLDEWRETYLSAGDTYTINLTGAEDGALIETPNNTEPFEVSLSSARLSRSTRAASPTDPAASTCPRQGAGAVDSAPVPRQEPQRQPSSGARCCSTLSSTCAL